MATAMWLMERNFHEKLWVELKLIKSYIWQTMRFDKFFMISILSELMIEELNHTLTTLRGSDSSILLDCHYMLIGITDGLWDPRELINGQ